MKFFIQTYGCEMNVAESASIAQTLESRGALPCDSEDEADVLIVNTCAVRKSAENRVFGQLGHYKFIKARTGLRIIFTGCMAESEMERLKAEYPFVDFIVGNNGKRTIPDIVFGSAGIADCSRYDFSDCYHHDGDLESYVPIQNGCDNFCSYCIVPYTRGREISRKFEDIIQEIEKIDAAGVRIATLLGQNVNSYNYSGKSFEDLVVAIDQLDLENLKWIYFDSPHPKDFTDSLVKLLAESRYFAHHYHIPVQSFSTEVLKKMNRHNTAEELFDLFSLLKNEIPDVSFSTDVMVGFPTEGESDFIATMDGIRRVRFTDAFMYYYNERPGTFAAKNFKDMDENTKKVRIEKLIGLQRGISAEVRKAKLGRCVKAYVRGTSKYSSNMLCYTASKEAVLVPPENLKPGDFVDVRLESLNGETFIGVKN